MEENNTLETDFTMSFVDFTFLYLFGILILFYLALILINPKQNKESPQVKAEFIITATWDKSSEDDVDLYTEDPNGHLVFFSRREDGLMHLDRDDLGKSNDRINTPNGEVIYEFNQEIVTIRGISPGEYVVNVHMYRKIDMDRTEIDGQPANLEYKPTKVTIRLDKLNPYSIITLNEVVLSKTGDEETAFRFVVDQEGNVSEINELKKRIATARDVDDETGYQEESGRTTPLLVE